VSFDGFDELVTCQASSPTLKEIDIEDCISHSVNFRSLLTICKIATLKTLRVRSFHFSWLKLSLMLHPDLVQTVSSQVLTHLSINFLCSLSEELDDASPHYVDGEPKKEFVERMFAHLPRLFPALATLHIRGVHSDLLNAGQLLPAVAGLVTSLSVRKCTTVLHLARYLPNLTNLEVNYCPQWQISSKVEATFTKLTRLCITKDFFRQSVDFTDLRDILRACVSLQELQISKVCLQVVKQDIDRSSSHNQQQQRQTVEPITEDDFLGLFDECPHLKNLRLISLDLTSVCCLGVCSVEFLLSHCSKLTHLENLLNWNITKEELDTLCLDSRFGFGVVYGSKYHSSLHWKGEDGRIYDPQLPVDGF